MALSVDNAQKVMIFGASKDLGVCRSKKKDGEPCTAFVNVSRCEYCVYHIRQEYQKCSKRSEIQSGFSGKGLTALRNKVLGKNEVFYAGKSYMAIPATKSRKLAAKDSNRLSSLSGNQVTLKSDIVKRKCPQRGQASRLEVSQGQRLKDLELLKKLGVEKNVAVDKPIFDGQLSREVTSEESKNEALNVIAKLNSRKQNTSNLQKDLPQENSNSNNLQFNGGNQSVSINSNSAFPQTTMLPGNMCALNSVPTLSGWKSAKEIDLNSPIPKTRINKAKLNALKYVQKNGPIEKVDPMRIRDKKKRILNEIDDGTEKGTKKQKLENSFCSDRFKKMMATTSKHTDLLEERDNEEAEKYFNKLELKEQMEEKMATTFKVSCKAVRCLQCKYVSFSAADLCKKEKHSLRVYDATKRFFSCGNCGNRTVTLEIFPMQPCKNCNGTKWERTGMMKEKKVTKIHTLSIRGGEQTFVNSVAINSNLNLMVPDDDQSL